jgi:hypothetical protein
MENTVRCESLEVDQNPPARAPTPPTHVRDTSPNSTEAPTDIFNMMCGGIVGHLLRLADFRDVEGYGVCCCGRNRRKWCRAQL